MKRLTLALSCCLALLTSHAELTKGLTRVCIGPDSTVSFMLYDHVHINCSEVQEKWQLIDLYVPTTRPYFDGKKLLRPGDTIFDSAGRKIGYIVSDKIDLGLMGSKESSKYTIRLRGYIAAANIDSTSTPEHELAALIMAHKDSITLTDLKDFMTTHDFGLHCAEMDGLEQVEPKYDYYSCYPDFLLGSNYRLLFVFNGRQLIGVFHPWRLRVPGYKNFPLVGAHLLWLKDQNDPAIKIFVKKYNWIIAQRQFIHG